LASCAVHAGPLPYSNVMFGLRHGGSPATLCLGACANVLQPGLPCVHPGRAAAILRRRGVVVVVSSRVGKCNHARVCYRGRGAVNSGARHGAIEVVGRRVLAAVVRMYSSLTSRGCSGRVVQRPHRGRGWFLAGASLVLRGDAMRSTCGACVLHTRAIPAAQTAAS
jgi:hypothetical protein